MLLAWATEAERNAIVEAGLVKYTDNTITDTAALAAELEQIRKRGWASAQEELEIGLNAVAAPIHDANDVVVGAIGVSGPSYRLAVASFPEVAKQVRVAHGADNEHAVVALSGMDDRVQFAATVGAVRAEAQVVLRRGRVQPGRGK